MTSSSGAIAGSQRDPFDRDQLGHSVEALTLDIHVQDRDLWPTPESYTAQISDSACDVDVSVFPFAKTCDKPPVDHGRISRSIERHHHLAPMGMPVTSPRKTEPIETGKTN